MKELEIALRNIQSLKEEIDLCNGVPDHDYSSALEMAITALEKQKEMIEHCEGSCAGCPYGNPNEQECMNHFIIK